MLATGGKTDVVGGAENGAWLTGRPHVLFTSCKISRSAASDAINLGERWNGQINSIRNHQLTHVCIGRDCMRHECQDQKIYNRPPHGTEQQYAMHRGL